jgi:xanthine/CO dehydrogenase XdhC/CoxF family maturation factor
MTDLERILPLWRELETAGADYVLATVVAVEGSSYRKPGAFMLMAPDGRRAGTVSGGCLEAQVASRAWWLTADGPTVQRYSTAEEDGERPYGSGCGGVVFLLLERRCTAAPLLAAVQQAFDRRIPMAVGTILDGPEIGRRVFAGLAVPSSDTTTMEGAPSLRRQFVARVGEHEPESEYPKRDLFSDREQQNPGAPGIASETWEGTTHDRATQPDLKNLANRALKARIPLDETIPEQGTEVRIWADYRPARPGLCIFGAGDDAQPLLRLAKELGWFVTVADGRSHLVTRERFPQADALQVLPIHQLPGSRPPLPGFPDFRPADAALLLTHSFEQDARILASLLAQDDPPAYIGVLGPQRRTREALAEAATLLGLPTSHSVIEGWMAQLHSPVGLDLGADSPETIALSILSEIQQSLTAATALPLNQLRADLVTTHPLETQVTLAAKNRAS